MQVASILLTLLVSPPLPPSSGETVTEAHTPDFTRAEQLFLDGQVLYTAADYVGAIAKFTEALKAVEQSGSTDFAVYGLLLYNIGKSHVRAYEIDQDANHLRQAREIYKQFIKDADVEVMMDQFDPADLADARRELELLETRLDKLTQPVPIPREPPTNWKRPRNLGLGLTISGATLSVGGVALLALGASLKPAAEQDVAKLADTGISETHPAWAEGDKYIAQETRRGRIFMALGGVGMGVGIIGVVAGGFQIKKAKRLRLNLLPAAQGIRLSGAF